MDEQVGCELLQTGGPSGSVHPGDTPWAAGWQVPARHGLVPASEPDPAPWEVVALDAMGLVLAAWEADGLALGAAARDEQIPGPARGGNRSDDALPPRYDACLERVSAPQPGAGLPYVAGRQTA